MAMAKEIRNSHFCIFVILFSQITVYMPMGINVTAMNPSTPAISVFINETFKMRYNISASHEDVQLIIALSQSMLIVGAVLAAVFVQILLLKISHCSILLLSHVIAIVSAILMSLVAKFTNSYESLIAGRLLNGIARGIAFPVIPVIVAETTNRRQLTLFQTPSDWLIQLGGIFGNIIGHPKLLGGENFWPYLLAFPALFSIAYVVLCYWLPQTPTHLILQERKTQKESTAESKKSFLLLKKLRIGTKKDRLQEYHKINEEIVADLHLQKASLCEIMKKTQYRRQLLGVTVVMFSIQATGIQAIQQYANTMFETAGISREYSTYCSIGFIGILSLSAIIATPLTLKFGARKLLLIGLTIAIVGLGMLSLSTVTSHVITGMSYVSILSLAVLAVGIAVGPSLNYIALSAELTTQITRPKVFWISGINFWVSGGLIAFVTPFCLEKIGGYFYLVFLGLVVLVVGYILTFVPDTHNRSVTEIQSNFLKNEKRHVKEQAKSQSLEEVLL